MKIVYRLEALADLQEQFSYIKNENPTAAAQVVASIRKTIMRLELFPFSGRKGIIEGTYELVVPRLPYIVVYRIGATIEILGIFHTSTNESRM